MGVDQRWWTVKDVADLLGVSREWAWFLMSSGRIKSERLGPLWVCRAADARKFVEAEAKKDVP